ncbi:hypothetical protein [Paraburkholderia sp. CI3]|uniref:hypothetical protein n=1 Tax=Paraburkholderia sp. CI3 TaxID=2991060 RepID=UPI003D21B815
MKIKSDDPYSATHLAAVHSSTGSGEVASPSNSAKNAQRPPDDRWNGALRSFTGANRNSSAASRHLRPSPPATLGPKADLPPEASFSLDKRHLPALPELRGAPASVIDLDLSGHPLKEFPVEQLLAMTKLQNLKLSMNAETGTPTRKSLKALTEEGLSPVWVRQGNSSAQVVNVHASAKTVLYTTDLDPCLAVMIVQGDKAMLMHVDSFSGRGSGRTSVRDVLLRHITPNGTDTSIMLVGANAQGAAANVRGVLSTLKSMGLEKNITMASLGNGHSSASLHVGGARGYVAFG